MYSKMYSLKNRTNHTSWEREKKNILISVNVCCSFLWKLQFSEGGFEVAFSLAPVFVTAQWEPASCQGHV